MYTVCTNLIFSLFQVFALDLSKSSTSWNKTMLPKMVYPRQGHNMEVVNGMLVLFVCQLNLNPSKPLFQT
jgi:hypothetical protein